MVIGWDIGGVNTKAAAVADGEVIAVRGRPYELQRDPGALIPLLREMAAEVSESGSGVVRHGVTMTAELSQMFRTKREGVHFVLDAVANAFPGAQVRVFAVPDRFIPPQEARDRHLAVAAANWAATARIVGTLYPDSVLIDVGTTTTDIIPIVNGRTAAIGWTDPDRLASGELVYTGAVRTPVEALVSTVPYGDGSAGVSAEAFALIGDVHVWRGDLEPEDYSVPPPDGRPVTREFSGERLARVVCADSELLGEDGVSQLAEAVASAQGARIADAIHRVVDRHAGLRTAVVTGVGAFIARAAARAAGLDVIELASELGDRAARCAPAAAVALLLERSPDAAST